jgi:hypothetical protein
VHNVAVQTISETSMSVSLSETKKLGSRRRSGKVNLSTSTLVATAIAICLASVIGGALLQSLRSSVPIIALQEVQSIDTCSQKILSSTDKSLLGNPVAANVTLKAINEICYDKGYKQAELNEYQIRRMQFFEQYYSERLFVWMVVGITISGVILAALQLAASYRLSSLGRGLPTDSAEISVERGKLVVKSSIMGVLILIISFAFFATYVRYIYPNQEVSVDDRAQSQSITNNRFGASVGPNAASGGRDSGRPTASPNSGDSGKLTAAPKSDNPTQTQPTITNGSDQLDDPVSIAPPKALSVRP